MDSSQQPQNFEETIPAVSFSVKQFQVNNLFINFCLLKDQRVYQAIQQNSRVVLQRLHQRLHHAQSPQHRGHLHNQLPGEVSQDESAHIDAISGASDARQRESNDCCSEDGNLQINPTCS
jgi:hypothetical protein